jgi:hypothetical protein
MLWYVEEVLYLDLINSLFLDARSSQQERYLASNLTSDPKLGELRYN